MKFSNNNLWLFFFFLGSLQYRSRRPAEPVLECDHPSLRDIRPPPLFELLHYLGLFRVSEEVTIMEGARTVTNIARTKES